MPVAFSLTALIMNNVTLMDNTIKIRVSLLYND